MEFLLLVRQYESAIMHPAQELALVKLTFEYLASGQDPRIKSVYPFVGERAAALLIEAASPEELQESVMSLPFFPLVKVETHVTTTARSELDVIGKVEQRIAEWTQGGAAG